MGIHNHGSTKIVLFSSPLAEIDLGQWGVMETSRHKGCKDTEGPITMLSSKLFHNWDGGF